MKTLILVLGLWLTGAAAFGIGHPHNLFATRHRLLVRTQSISKPVSPALPAARAESPTTTKADWQTVLAQALCRSCHRLVTPLLVISPVYGAIVGGVLVLTDRY